MNRWTHRALATGLALFAATAAAQTPGLIREAPQDVKPAVLAVSATPPIVTLNGAPDRLSPGARIRDRNNMLVLSGQLAGQTVYGLYKRDAAGLVHEVWLLSPDEYRRLGGTDVGDAAGVARFVQMLNAIFLARAQGAAK